MYSNKSGYGASGGGGGSGKDLEFDWDGTRLGVRQEGNDKFEYTDLKGKKGDKGNPGSDGSDGEQGPQGEQGPPGNDGKDGFPSEEQWNALVARVDALEGGNESE